MRRIVQWIGLLLLVAGTANAQSWTAVSPEGGRCKVDMPGTPIRLYLRSGENPYANRRKPNVTALDKHKPRRLDG